MCRHSGIGTYIRSLLQRLTLKLEYDFTLFGKLEQIVNYPAKKVSAEFPIYSLREQFLLPYLLERHPVKLLHLPHYNVPLGYSGRIVVTIHDLIHLKFPPSRAAYFYARTMLEAACRKAAMILVNSQNTKNDLMEMLGVKEEKIMVSLLAVEPEEETQNKELLALKKEHVLFVGNIKPHKNVITLIRAFKKAQIKNPDLKLVIVGKDFMPDLTALYRGDPGIEFLNEISPQKIKHVYCRSRLLVLPSFYEGFGLPILEAMRWGVPVACSNVASMPEVAGEAALFFDPQDVGGLAQIISDVWESESVRQGLIRKGYVQLEKFSWDRCAELTAQVYERSLVPGK